jgi:hypothetical protein
MTRGILIAGNESTLSRSIEAEVAKRVAHFAVALIPNRLSDRSPVPAAGHPDQSPVETARLPLSWNPGSPISARTLVLAAENRLERIDEAVLICAPPPIRRPVAELPLADIEILINDHIKGWFFLVRELAAVFRTRQAGTLALVYADSAAGGRDDAADLLGPSSLASFQALTRGLLSSAFNEPYFTIGFSCSDAGSEAAFASFVVKTLDESGRRGKGKLHKYGKFNLFK